MIAGSMVALVTPMDAQGGLDWDSLSKLVDFHLQEGTNAIVAVGTTGEASTLEVSEHIEVIRRVVDQVNGRIPVIAGTGANSTREAVELTENAKQAGADACLLVTPYYNKPTQEGQYQHFKAISDAVDIPIFLYNIPGRTIVDISVETMVRIAQLKNVVGVKDATSNLARTSLQRHLIGPDFIQLSGEDATSLGFNAHGGVGSISVTANVAPKLCAEFQTATLNADFKRALEIQDRLMPLHHALFVEPNPAPVKYAASLLGLCRDELRLPLMSVTEATQLRVRDAMRHAGLLN